MFYKYLYLNKIKSTCNEKEEQMWELKKLKGKKGQEAFLMPDPNNDKNKKNNGAKKEFCVTFFSKPKYEGDKRELCGEQNNLSTIGWKNKISSFHIPKGTKLELFKEENFKGKKKSFRDNTPTLKEIGWDNKTASMKATKALPKACLTLFEQKNYGGKKLEICGVVKNLIPLGWNDRAASMKIPKGNLVDFFKDINFQGMKMTLGEDVPDFAKIGLLNKIHSAKVVKNTKPPPVKKPNKDLEPGIYRVISVNSNKCLDVSGVSKTAGAKVIQWQCHGGLNQDWEVTYTPEGFSTLISSNSKLALAVEKGSKDNGDIMVQQAFTSKPNQQFIIQKDNGVFVVKSKHSQKCVDVSGGSKDNGPGIIQVSLINKFS